MTRVDFTTPIRFGEQLRTTTDRLLEMVDSYFLSRRVAHIVPGTIEEGSHGVVLLEEPLPILTTGLKIISYITVVMPLVMGGAKLILRSSHSFHVIDPKVVLEEGIEITAAITATIERLMPQILSGERIDEIIWHSRGNNLVFSLACAPDLIFKMAIRSAFRQHRGTLSPEQITELRFSNMIQAQMVCLIHHLDRLVIPHAKLFRVGETSLIAEQRMDITSDYSIQERAYHELGSLEETARQLAFFIVKTGFSDVELRNIPLLLPNLSSPPTRRVVLIDIEEMESSRTGIFGGAFRKGLIRCLGSEEQIDCALSVARKHRVAPWIDTPDDHRRRRTKEIASYRALMAFYQSKGIDLEERQPIGVSDLETLDLPLECQGAIPAHEERIPAPGEATWDRAHVTYTLRQATEDVIAHINRALEAAPKSASTKRKRFIHLEFNGPLDPIFQYHHLQMPGSTKSWLEAILGALVETGHLFKFENKGIFFEVQA